MRKTVAITIKAAGNLFKDTEGKDEAFFDGLGAEFKTGMIYAMKEATLTKVRDALNLDDSFVVDVGVVIDIADDQKETIVNNFDIFEDRVRSLLERWRKFVDKNPDKHRESVIGCMHEIDDNFTKHLMETPQE